MACSGDCEVNEVAMLLLALLPAGGGEAVEVAVLLLSSLLAGVAGSMILRYYSLLYFLWGVAKLLKCGVAPFLSPCGGFRG